MANHRIAAFVLFFTSLHTSLASGPYHSLADLWSGEIGDLTDYLSLSPYLGGQNFYQCCLKALNESLLIEDGNVEFVPGQTLLHGTIPELLSYQNPCTASYNGSDGDQPQLTISYNWCSRTCPGWQRTNNRYAAEWLQPLIAFILPTIVFCFSIPRRRRIIIPPWLFPYNRLVDFPGNLTLIYKIPVSIALLVLDAIIWALTSIVVAGPMIISGCLERMLDSRLLEFLCASKNEKIITTQLRSHILLVVLIGNLDVESTWHHCDNLVKSLGDASLSTHGTTATTEVRHENDQGSITSCEHISQSSDSGEKSIVTKEDISVQVSAVQPKLSIPKLQILDDNDNIRLHGMKTKLSSLLESQPTFGASVGIGVLFYTSSFVYSIMEIRQSYGDSSTSHSLAFGIFWMIVGHLAVIAAILLAGNNPSAFEAIASEFIYPAQPNVSPVQWKNKDSHCTSSIQIKVKSWVKLSIQKRRLALPASLKQSLYRTSFPSKFKSAWMWNRGWSKALWIAQMAENNPQLKELQTSVLHVGWASWCFEMIFPTVMLIVVPSFLGGMTSYTTPTIGLSCRSMIPLLYASSQVILSLLCVWDWTYWKTARTGNFITAKELRDQKMKLLSAVELLWYGIFMLSIVTAIFAAFGGTVFHLMGLFQNCLCWIPIWQWSRRNSPTTMTYLSSNSAEQIYYARRYWLPIGITATALLLITTYFGWQYQHRLRRDFANQVELLGTETNNKAEVQPIHSPRENSDISPIDNPSPSSDTTMHKF